MGTSPHKLQDSEAQNVGQGHLVIVCAHTISPTQNVPTGLKKMMTGTIAYQGLTQLSFLTQLSRTLQPIIKPVCSVK